MFQFKTVLPLLIVLASPLMAQHQEQITVSLVEVPVWVTTLTGNPARDLTKSDFELYVNGARQPIDYFDVLLEEASAAKLEPQRRELRRRRLYLLLFDLTTLPRYQMRKARESALRFVSNAPAGETFAVATLSLAGIHFAAPFTTDRIAVERAIRTLTASGAGDAFNLAMLESERSAGTPALMPEAGPGDLAGVGPAVSWVRPPNATAKLFLEEADMMETAASMRLRERSIDNLAILADTLAPLSGVKHVVILGTGRPMDDLVVGHGGAGYLNYLSRVHERYRLAGVTLNGIDVGGPSVPWTGASSRQPSNVGGLMQDPQRRLRDLVGGTGGTVAYNLNTLRAQYSVTYVLGFRPPADQRRKENAISVKVRNRPFGSLVRYRQGYSIERARPTAGEGIFLADVLLNDIEQNGLTVGVDVDQRGEDVTLTASVPGPEVLGYGTYGATLMDVFLYVFDEHDVVAWWKHVRLRVDLESGREFLLTNPYRVRQQIRLRPGRYSAKALLQVVGSDATGFRRTDFRIPQE